MKKVIVMSVAMLLFSCCCQHEQKLIEKAAYNYSYAMANYQIDEAEKYATEETKNSTLKMAKEIVKKVDSNYIKSDMPATIDIVDVKVVNDTCAVATYHKVTPLKDFSDTLELRKRGGQWKAYVIPRRVAPPVQQDTSKAGPAIRSFQDVKQGK